MNKKTNGARRLLEDRPSVEVKRYSRRGAAAALSVISVLLCGMSIGGFLWIRLRFSDVDAIKLWIDDNYALGIAIMILLCAVQVVIALIPGELLEIAAGYAFGGVVGAVVCVIGITLGSIVAILLARRFGRRLVESLYPKEKLDALPILNDPKKRNTLVFVLFLIPGTPKDLLTYVIGLTNMSIPAYLLLTTFARLPSVISSTFGGGALGDNELLKAAVIFVIVGVVSAVGYIAYNSISSARHRKAQTKENANENENE